jgi:hypothetical protein
LGAKAETLFWYGQDAYTTPTFSDFGLSGAVLDPANMTNPAQNGHKFFMSNHILPHCLTISAVLSGCSGPVRKTRDRSKRFGRCRILAPPKACFAAKKLISSAGHVLPEV